MTAALATPEVTIIRRGEAAARALTAEVLVVGAGIAGITAAVEAARLGRRVVLADAGPALGGQSVGSMIGTFCGLYGNGPHFPQLTHGLGSELLADLRADGAAHDLVGRRNTIIVQYRIDALARWIERTVAAEPIEVLLGAVLTDVARTERRLGTARFATRHGAVEVRATSIVDATGDAAVAWVAGLACTQSGDGPVQGTVMATLSGVDGAALAALPKGAIRASLEAAGPAAGLVRHDGFAFQFPGADEVLVNMTHIDTPLDPLAQAAMLADGRSQVDRLLDFLKRQFPAAFATARVSRYGLPGIRQTRSILGRSRLSVDAVRSGTRPDDAIGRCSWPIEYHGTPEQAVWEEFGDHHLHWLPLGCQLHAEADNLIAAGRCIDADPLALSSVRVMGPCIAMGTAAAHVADLAGSGVLGDVDRQRLAGRLAHNLGL